MIISSLILKKVSRVKLLTWKDHWKILNRLSICYKNK